MMLFFFNLQMVGLQFLQNENTLLRITGTYSREKKPFSKIKNDKITRFSLFFIHQSFLLCPIDRLNPAVSNMIVIQLFNVQPTFSFIQ
jgi:hypothetical protein